MENLTEQQIKEWQQDYADSLPSIMSEPQERLTVELNQYVFLRYVDTQCEVFVEAFVYSEDKHNYHIDCSKTHIHGKLPFFVSKSGFTNWSKSTFEVMNCFDFNEKVGTRKEYYTY